MLSQLRNRAGKRLREPFGKAGLTVAVVALVFAMLGGAYAASNNNGGKATASKAKAGPRGPRGKTGPAGPAGPAGPQGPAGANGKDGGEGKQGPEGKAGTNGTNGTDGTDGTNGASPENVEEFDTSDARCAHSGGVVYEAEGIPGSKSTVCNGEKGPKGDTGAPWPVAGTLPSGATETGTWAFTGTTADTNGIHVALSFPIPLATELDEEHVHYFSQPDFSVSCKGSANQPEPTPGNLCVYAAEVPAGAPFAGIYRSVEEEFGEKGAYKQGAVLAFKAPTAAVSGSGTFTVTAP